MRVVIYDKKENELQYYNLMQCYKSAVIDTKHELIGEDNANRLGLQALYDERYVIRREELVGLLLHLDDKVKDVERDD